MIRLCLLVLVVSLAVACGGGGDAAAPAEEASNAAAANAAAADEAEAAGDDAEADIADEAAQDDADADDEAPAAAPEAAAGTLQLGDEVIALDRARCFLEEQDAAGSEGKILFTAQGFGTTAEEEELVVDVSRYDEDSPFTGDDIQLDIGDPRGEDFYSWESLADLGTIEQDGRTLSADGLTFRHSEDGSELPGSFEIRC